MSGLSSNMFAKSAVHCIEQAIKAEKEITAKLWLDFAIRDIKMCLVYHRKGQ